MRRVMWMIPVLLLALVMQPVAQAAPRSVSSLPSAIAQSYDGRDLALGRVLARTGAYTKYAATYRGSGLKLTGVMVLPNGDGPFPVIVLAHGYIDPRIYTTGRGFLREQDALARSGYAAFHVDYRNHAGSDRDRNNDINFRLGYSADVINAGLAVRNSKIKKLDGSRIGVMGRSMGGTVALNAMIIEPDLFGAGVLYSSVSADVVDNFNTWQRRNASLREAIFSRHGRPKDRPETWAAASAINYVSRVAEPVLIFHGERDSTCPIAWSRATHRALLRAGVDATLITYPGEGHTFAARWRDSIRESIRFFNRNL
jgi:dipeptidyl aminopeptidase/acylaminoacyl peptidase